MDDLTYLNFDLTILHSGNTYRVRVDSPGGQASASFTLPFSEEEISSFLARFGSEDEGTQAAAVPLSDAVKSFGGRLYKAVFAGQILACLVRSQDEADRQKKGLRIRLNLSDAPELGRLPWEFLYDESLNRFLGVSKNTPIVRYLDLPEQIRSLEVEPPLQVLVMISSPTDQPPLDVDGEWDRLHKAVGDLEKRGKLVLERMDKPTLSDLQDRLRGGPVHILHFIGHGVFDETSKDGVLLFERENGRGDPVSGGKLGTLLHDQSSLRLVILNACQGASGSATDPYSGAAQGLVQQGIPAVIAMQFEIGDEAAVTFSQNFYKSISDNYPVDGALAEARKAINSTRSALEWATPVLYMRAGDGRIFVTGAKSAPAAVTRSAQVPMSQVGAPSVSPTAAPPARATKPGGRGLPVVPLIAGVLLLFVVVGIGLFALAGSPGSDATNTPDAAQAAVPSVAIATATSRPADTATPVPPATAVAVVQAGPTTAPTSTPANSPTTVPAAPPTATAPPPTPVPTAVPTVALAPNTYVTAIRTDPAAPKRGLPVIFDVTFLNTRGSPTGFRWRVRVFKPDNLRSSLGDTSPRNSSIPVGATELATADNWHLSGNIDCTSLVAQVFWVDPET
ncbi:MAG TPA: CHAT domain-containing protein, partial [Anaerolineae bacterium]